MNIFIQEMRANRKSLLIWSTAILFMVFAGMSKFGGFSSESGEMMNNLLANMPKSLQAIMGVGELDLSKVSGYYGMLYLYLVLMGTIHSVMLGATIISKEERDLTAEFLFVKPISRVQVITAKLSAAFLNVFVFNSVTYVSSFIVIRQFSNGEDTSSILMRLMIGLIILQILFLFVGSATAAITSRPKRAATLASAVLLVTFIISVFIDMSGKVDWLKYGTPFKYFEAKDLIAGNGFSGINITISFVIIAVSIATTYMFYNKRDLNV